MFLETRLPGCISGDWGNNVALSRLVSIILDYMYNHVHVITNRSDLPSETYIESQLGPKAGIPPGESDASGGIGPKHIVTSTSGFSARCRPMRPISLVEF